MHGDHREPANTHIRDMVRPDGSDQEGASVKRPLGMERWACKGRLECPMWLPPSGVHVVGAERTPSL